MLRLYEVHCTYKGERVPVKLAVSDDEVALQESYLAMGYDSCGVDSIRYVDGYAIAVLDEGEYVAKATDGR